MQKITTRHAQQKDKRELFRQEALAAWAHYSATGEHVSEAAADVWLEQLTQGQDIELPACPISDSQVRAEPTFRLKEASVGSHAVLKSAPADWQRLEEEHVCDRILAQGASR